MSLRSPTNACITSVVDHCLICLFLPGVSKAVEHVNKTIAPALISKVGAVCLLLTSANAVCLNPWVLSLETVNGAVFGGWGDILSV